MERVLVEGTVKEAWMRRFKISIANHRRDRVPETKILGMEGFHWLDTKIFTDCFVAVAMLAMTGVQISFF